MKAYGKYIAGCAALVVLAAAGIVLQQMTAAVSADRQAAAVPADKSPEIACIGDDFSLPAVDNALPVYDRYTTAARKDAGLPLTYGTSRAYFYGDHVAYLTFDDGPNEANTEKILDILHQENIHATFFLTGQNVERYPDVVRQIYQSGNAIGIHSYSHDYKKIYVSPQAYIDELLRTEELIYGIIGVRPVISRAPGGTQGHFTKEYWQAINRIGYIEVGWNALTGDADGTAKTADQAVSNVKKQLQLRPYLHSHLVILMHDAAGHEATVQALPAIIRLLRENGYSFRVVTTAIPPSW